MSKNRLGTIILVEHISTFHNNPILPALLHEGVECIVVIETKRRDSREIEGMILQEIQLTQHRISAMEIVLPVIPEDFSEKNRERYGKHQPSKKNSSSSVGKFGPNKHVKRLLPRNSTK